MSNTEGNLSVNLLAGQTIRVKAPIKKTHGTGWFPKQNSDGSDAVVEYEGVNRQLVNGFLLAYEDVGAITAGATPNEIIYDHKKSFVQYIVFFADTGEMGMVSVVPMPIHDHSSVTQGGPAYGSYFSDDEEFDADPR